MGTFFGIRVWLRRWRAKSSERRRDRSREVWALSEWLHHFDPTERGAGGDRSWWWQAGSDEPGRGWVEVATTGWPFGSGSLCWLIEAGGGTVLDYGS
ncbi:hypothetical protein [Streptomyces sp. 142MFCol3.1]|uniref:hypothetical protein n=1 Tax=Streptomyces sp. 142MFCol3.1 TaxID=1172179 RepID=UPI0003F89E56|nr:hypothetical protein [Streptomyces sp. 142MFCol3.1]